MANLIGEIHPEWLSRHIYFGHIFNTYLLKTVVFTPSIMFRRAVLKSVGLQEPKFGFFHDLEFVLRICKHYRVAFIDIPIYKLRYHAGQISTTKGERGARNAIKKQRDLLQVLKDHGLRDKDYYQQHRKAIDRQLARLHRAVAIPLLSYSQGSSHQNKHYPKRARKYLQKCSALGQPECYLWLLSFLPHFWRRLGFLALRLGQQSALLVRGRKPFHDFS
jgi:hypothetical protein